MLKSGLWRWAAAGAWLASASGAVLAQTAPSSCPVATGVRPSDTSSSSCLSCHDPSGRSSGAGGHSSSHPVQIDYATAQGASRSELRSPQEVVKRGVFLPGGKVECLTCHDPNSRWKYHLAIPPGAKVTPYVVLGNRDTFEDGPARTRLTQELSVPGGEPKAASPKPLCLGCHALD